MISTIYSTVGLCTLNLDYHTFPATVMVGSFCMSPFCVRKMDFFIFKKQNRRAFMLQIRNLTLTHRADLRVLLEQFHLVLNDGDKAVRTRIRTYLGALKYTAEEMDHPIGSLSGGQKAKILLLKMSLSAANVLLLDEPTRNFSPLSGPVIRKMIASFPGAVISISHDRKYIKEVCTKTYQLTETGLRPL